MPRTDVRGHDSLNGRGDAVLPFEHLDLVIHPGDAQIGEVDVCAKASEERLDDRQCRLRLVLGDDLAGVAGEGIPDACAAGLNAVAHAPRRPPNDARLELKSLRIE